MAQEIKDNQSNLKLYGTGIYKSYTNHFAAIFRISMSESLCTCGITGAGGTMQRMSRLKWRFWAGKVRQGGATRSFSLKIGYQ